MKYIINDYHKNITKAELIKDLLNVANKLNKQYLSRSEYSSIGKFSANPYIRVFGTWKNALASAGLSTYRVKEDYYRINNDELIEDIRHVADVLHKDTITTLDYKMYGKHRIQTVLARFVSWNNALNKSKLCSTKYHKITDDELFEEIEKMWIKKGSQPTTSDIRNGLSKFSLNTYSRHFGGWRFALKEFILWVKSDKGDCSINSEQSSCENIVMPNNNEVNIKNINLINVKHRTGREANLRLRFKVLQRDNFKCCLCWASPAKDPTVELHVDHIIPWSKGGETTIENLQTLCSKCNYGKSDL